MFTWRCATVSLSPKDDVYPAVIYPGNGQIWTVPPFQPPQWVKLGPKLTTHQLGIFHSPKWFIAHMPCTKIECCSCCSHIGGWSSTGWWFQRFFFFHILGISSSQVTWTPWFFRGVGLNHQPVNHINPWIEIYIPIYPLQGFLCMTIPRSSHVTWPCYKGLVENAFSWCT